MTSSRLRRLPLSTLLVAFALAAAILIGAGCSGGQAPAHPGDRAGRIALSILSTPGDARCLEVLAEGRTRTEPRRFDAAPDHPFSRELTMLPLGPVTFRGRAFRVPCAAVAEGDVPTWASDPVAASLTAGVIAPIALVFKRNGQAQVTPSWEPDGRDAASTDARPPDTAPPADQPLPVPGDVRQALARLPFAEVDAVRLDGLPRSVSGHLALVPGLTADSARAGALAAAVAELAPLFRLEPANLLVEAAQADEQGHLHLRLAQRKNGLPVVGGVLLLHVDPRGVLYNAAGSAADGVELPAQALVPPAVAEAVALARPGLVAPRSSTAPRLVYTLSTRDERLYLAYDVTVEGEDAGGAAQGERVFVDATTGLEVDAWGLVPSALQRTVFSSLLASPSRTEGSAPIGNAVVDTHYDLLGDAYRCYAQLFARDSFDGRGAPLESRVNFPLMSCNAAWNGTSMLFGVASAAGGCTNLGTSPDVVTHELTHAVTQHGAALVYANEPGALNEAFSDIFAAICDGWKRGSVDGRTWLVGEDAFTRPYGLRSMADPAVDGSSRDYYPQRFTGFGDHGGVHLNSGIANLAFKLLVAGGSHPRGKTATAVAGVGMAVARDVFYRMNSHLQLSPQARFQDARAASLRLALQFHGTTARNAVAQAWDAVGVSYFAGDPAPVPPPPRCEVTLSQAAASFGFGGGSGSVRVRTLPAGCGWAASTTASWITVEPPASGAGDATIVYRVASNPSTSARTAAVIVGGQSLVVSQQANLFTCVYVTAPDEASFPAAGGAGSATISTGVLCPWTASSPVPWITITGGASGGGNGTISYQVAANPGPEARSASLSLAGAPLRVVQSAPPARRRLLIDVLGDGAVTAGLNRCGASGCSWVFDAGTRVRLTAVGESFRGWAGDCAPAGSGRLCDLVLDGDRVVSADFRVGPPPLDGGAPDGGPPPARTLAVTIEGAGTVAIPGAASCNQSCTRQVADGAALTLSASGGEFRSWGGDCAAAGSSPRCPLVMSASRKVTAVFAAAPPPPPPPPRPVITWTATTLSPVPFSVPSDGPYILEIDVTSPLVAGFVRILQTGGVVDQEIARADCRVPEGGTPPCKAARNVSLSRTGRYLVDFQLFHLRTGASTIGGHARLLR